MKELTEIHTLQITFVERDLSDSMIADIERSVSDPETMREFADRIKHALNADDVQIVKSQLFIGGENNG